MVHSMFTDLLPPEGGEGPPTSPLGFIAKNILTPHETRQE